MSLKVSRSVSECDCMLLIDDRWTFIALQYLPRWGRDYIPRMFS
jgi:hypothetical protein